MRKILILVLVILLFPLPVYALEAVRQKNQATYIMFPAVDADGDAVSAAAGLDSEIDTWSDGVAPNGFVDCTNEATEVGTNGVYYLSLTAAEMNADYVYIQVKTTTTGAKTQHILIRTLVGDPLNLATTDDGSAINVTSGAVDTVTGVTNDVGITQAGADKVWSSTTRSLTDKDGFRLSAAGVDDVWDELTTGHITAGSYGKLLTDNINATISSRSSHSAADVWSVATRTVTGGTINTNNDKTGYSLTQTFPTNFSSLSIDSSGRVTPTPVESMVLHSGTAQAGAAGSITLASGASSTDDLYKGMLVKIYGGTGVGQARTITAYNGTTKVATVAWSWTTNPDSTSTYALIASGNPSINSSLQVSTTASDPWATALPGLYGAGTAGKILGDNLNATVSSRLAASAAPTNFSSMAITAGGAVTVGTNNDKTGYRLSAAGVDDIWDEAQSGHITAGTFGKYLDKEISGIDDNPWDNATRTLTAFGFSIDLSAGAVDAIWDEGQSGHVTAGTFGKYLDEAISGIDDNPWDNATRTITGGTITTNNDKTGYSLTQSFPTNFASLAIDTNGRMDLGKWLGLAPNALISGRVDANA